MTYLVFDIGYSYWRPSGKKLVALLKAEIYSFKDLKKFLGACDFYRRHVKGFSFTSARLSDKLKKNLKWFWDKDDQEAFEQFKKKLCDVKLITWHSNKCWRGNYGFQCLKYWRRIIFVLISATFRRRISMHKRKI